MPVQTAGATKMPLEFSKKQATMFFFVFKDKPATGLPIFLYGRIRA